MPGYDQRASILRGAGATIFNMVCERSTPEQWAEWLRVPLEHAAGTANADLVDTLLKAGADGSAGWKGCEGKTLLHAGAEGGNERVMSALMRAGAKEDMNKKVGVTGGTPLHLAVHCGKVATADALMLAGADANILDANNEGPLHLAIRGGHTGIAKNLIIRGANPEVMAWSGHFPIHLAADRGQDDTVRSLLLTGAQVDRLGDDGWTPLCRAVRRGHLSTVKVLLEGGADVAILSGGQTPLHLAVQEKADILAALVEAGADIETKTSGGLTVLHTSAYYGACAAMRALLRLGADVHVTGTMSGCSPLHLACIGGKLDSADLLLRWGADETALDKKGRTPSDKIPKIAEAAEEDRPRLERLSKLLASAPQDRAWRRRGMLVMCRAHPDRLRLVMEIPDTSEPRGQPQGRPSRRARRSEVKVEITMGGTRNGGGGEGAGSSADGGGGRRAARVGSGGGGGGGGGFDGVAAWLVALQEEGVFRKIMGFL